MTSDFVLLPNKPIAPDVKSGHMTSVVYHRGADYDYVEKVINPMGVFGYNQEAWHNKMTDSRAVSQLIRGRGNMAYYIPRTFISHGRVRETVASGVSASDLSFDYMARNSDWIIPAIGNFINDVSELQPVIEYRCDYLAGTAVRAENFEKALNKFQGIASDKDIKYIMDTYNYLAAQPENMHQVLYHMDLNDENIFIDAKNRRVTILDFEIVNYCTQFQVMYNQYSQYKKLWRYIDRLPRARNANIRWNYNENVAHLYHVVRNITYNSRFHLHNGKDEPLAVSREYFAMSVNKLRVLRAKIRASERYRARKNVITAVVPMSQYVK